MKIVSLLLVLVMLFPLAACNTDPVDPVDTKDTTKGTTPADSVTTDDMAIQTGEAYYSVSDYLPTETFDGEDIHVWIDDGSHGYYNLMEDQIIEGDVIHAAIVDRNAAVENNYDVVLNWNRDYSGYRNKPVFRQSVLAGDEYDLVGGPSLNVNPLLVYGCFYDMADNEYIDFSQPWWIPEATANQRVYDRQFTATGYFDFWTISRICVFYFNGNMVDDYQFGNLYDLVNEGGWTWEKMMEMCETVAADVNQDGIMDESDRFGLSSRWDYFSGQESTAGYQYVTIDANGEYVITGVTDDLLEINSKIYPVISDTNDIYYSQYTYGVHTSAQSKLSSKARTMFCNNQILFMNDQLVRTTIDQYRNFGAYGILPSPKYLEGQEDYGTSSGAYISAICSTTGDLKISSIILEALQIESYNILRPAYITQALSYKYLNDPQAVEMLNRIFRSVTTDWAYNFSGAGLGQDLFRAGVTEQYLGSFFQQNASVIEQQLSDFLVTVESLP